MKEQCESMHELNDNYLPEAPPLGHRRRVSLPPKFSRSCWPTAAAVTADARGAGVGGRGAVSVWVRQGLVSQPSREVGMRLVEPGSPEQSWLWRKLTGDFSGIDCVGCKNRMPQAGAAPNASEMEVIRSWIAGGAP